MYKNGGMDGGFLFSGREVHSLFRGKAGDPACALNQSDGEQSFSVERDRCGVVTENINENKKFGCRIAA